MAQQNRTKEIWLIPKRVNLHQTICLLDGIIVRKYDCTNWNPGKQNNLGVNLKNWGATKSGKNISPQAIRTLFASVPQYLGFAYINTSTTPNTVCITEAGYHLWNRHKNELVKIDNLVLGADKTITTSEIVLQQLEKLQITNPIILKDCENILTFPFRITLKLLDKLDYLDMEELAYYVFKIKDESELELTIYEITNFRNMEIEKRKEMIDLFKKTHVGNITLVQAASSKYYESLCQMSGIIEKYRYKPTNSTLNLSCIRIKNQYKNYVKYVIDEKYKDIKPFDFKNDLKLWIDYIGNPKRLSPPFYVALINDEEADVFILIKKEDEYIWCDILKGKGIVEIPMFPDEKYNIEISNIYDGNRIGDMEIIPTKHVNKFKLDIGKIKTVNSDISFKNVSREIIEHSSSKNFTEKMNNYLHILNKLTGIDKTQDKSLRGAYYEFLFYKLLNILKKENKIDEVIWNGKIGKFNLPVSAPGGKLGNPDIIFSIDKTDYVLELTTIKSKSMQFSAECSSVPDHIRLYKKSTVNDVVGIFVAPLIHERNVNIMNSVLKEEGINIICLTDLDFINLLSNENIKEQLIKYM